MSIVEVKVPQLSESVSEATMLQWKKKPGEKVQRDEILIEIETDKVVLEVPAPANGVLRELKNSWQSHGGLAVLPAAQDHVQKNHLGLRPPVGVETVAIYPLGGRERPTAFWWHVPRKKTWSMGCCARESGDAVWRSRLGN